MTALCCEKQMPVTQFMVSLIARRDMAEVPAFNLQKCVSPEWTALK